MKCFKYWLKSAIRVVLHFLEKVYKIKLEVKETYTTNQCSCNKKIRQ